MTGDHPATTAGVVAPPPLVFLAGFLAGIGLDRLARLPPLGLDLQASLALGATAVVLGAALILAAIVTLARARTAVEPWRPTTAIVTGGVFARSRNPIYLGLAVAHFGSAVIAGSIGALVLLVPVLLVIHFGVIRREERYLDARFGETYRAYRSRVRRWL